MDNGKWFIVLLGLVLGAACYDVYIAIQHILEFFIELAVRLAAG